MEKELDYNDVLLFPVNLVYKKIDGKNLIVSPYTANWIVIEDKAMKYLHSLMEGNSVGDVLESCDDEENPVFLNLLKAICAQEFAGTEKIEPVNLHSFDNMAILLTNRCNLRCRHCYLYSGEKTGEELSLDEWKRVLLEFSEHGGKHVSFSGGEPLLYKGLDELLKYAKELGLEVKLYTNGILWNDRLIKDLIGYIDEVQVSLDGYDEQTNSYIRGNGYFVKVYDTIIKLSTEGVKVKVATTLDLKALDENTKYLYKSFCERIKRDSGNADIEFALTKRFINGRNVHLSKEENDEYEKKIRIIENYATNGLSIANFISSTEKNSIVCNCGIGSLTIISNGDVSVCNRFEEMGVLGNIKNAPLIKFIEEGKSIFRKSSVDNITECSECYLRYICGGGCRLDNFENIGGTLIRHTCSTEDKEILEKKMMDSFCCYYDFK